MHILITGAAGMIGRKLTVRLVKDGKLNGKTNRPVDADRRGRAGKAGRLCRPGRNLGPPIWRRPAPRRKRSRASPDVIFHLAGVVSGEAETDFEKGYHVNLDGTRALLEAIRAVGDYKPKVVFTSSIAVFGAPFPHAIPDEFHLTPLTSYGTQKAISELLLADYTRRGISRRRRHPPADDLRAAGQAEQGGLGFLLRHHPRAARRQEAVLPVAESVLHTHASPRSAVGFLIHAAGLTREQLGTASISPCRRWRSARSCKICFTRVCGVTGSPGTARPAPGCIRTGLIRTCGSAARPAVGSGRSGTCTPASPPECSC